MRASFQVNYNLFSFTRRRLDNSIIYLNSHALNNNRNITQILLKHMRGIFTFFKITRFVEIEIL